MRPAGWITAVGGISAVVGGLAIIDERVRFELVSLAHGTGSTGDFVSASSKMQDVVTVFLQAVRDQSIEHAPLTIFSLCALVLVLFMLRT